MTHKKTRQQNIAIYPGSFDPVTLGHINIMERAAPRFDRLIIAISNNVNKKNWFTLEQRQQLLEEAIGHIHNVDIDTFSQLTVHYAAQQNASTIVRGVRCSADFEYETRLAMTNQKLNPNVETILMIAHPQYMDVHASTAKEIIKYGGDVKHFVPDHVAVALQTKLDSFHHDRLHL